MRKSLVLILALTMILTISIPAATVALPQGAQDVNAFVNASVNKIPGNKNELTIVVQDNHGVYTETFLINNNAAEIYTIGEYAVYVDTKGNDQIRQCYIVSYNPLNIYIDSLFPAFINKTAGDIFMLAPSISVLGSLDGLVWQSNNTEVAVVDQTGMVTCLGSGTAVIKMTSAANKIYSECVIYVTGTAATWLIGSKSYTFDDYQMVSDWRYGNGGEIAPDEITIWEDGSIGQENGHYILSPTVVAPGQPVIIKAEVRAAIDYR